MTHPTDERPKPIRLTEHARQYVNRRGFTEAEVAETSRTASWQAARGDRLEAAKDFPYDDYWNGVFHVTKRVRPVFVEEASEIVVITVYTYFF